MDSTKLCSVNVKVCWIIFLVLNALTLVFMTVELLGANWVSLDASNVRLTFNGSLSSFRDTSLSLKKYRGEFYSKAAEDWCELADESLLNTDYFEAGCAMFSTLAICCFTFMAMECLALGYTVMNIVAFSIFLCKIDVIWLSMFSIVLSNFWHILGFMLYSSFNRLNYENECEIFRNANEPADLCAESGAFISLFLFIFIFIYGLIQFVCVSIYYCKKTQMGISFWCLSLDPNCTPFQPYQNEIPMGNQVHIPEEPIINPFQIASDCEDESADRP